MIQLLQFVLGAKIEIKNLVCIIKIRICNFLRENSTPESSWPRFLDYCFFLCFWSGNQYFPTKNKCFFFTISTNYLFIYYLRQVFEEKTPD